MANKSLRVFYYFKFIFTLDTKYLDLKIFADFQQNNLTFCCTFTASPLYYIVTKRQCRTKNLEIMKKKLDKNKSTAIKEHYNR